MTDLGKQLRDGDPLADSPALAPEDVQRIRRAILDAAGRPAPLWWPRPAMVGATIAATLAAGVLIGRSLPEQLKQPAGLEEPQPTEPVRRQVQFDTPGGTRIIWVIDPDFDM